MVRRNSHMNLVFALAHCRCLQVLPVDNFRLPTFWSGRGGGLARTVFMRGRAVISSAKFCCMVVFGGDINLSRVWMTFFSFEIVMWVSEILNTQGVMFDMGCSDNERTICSDVRTTTWLDLRVLLLLLLAATRGRMKMKQNLARRSYCFYHWRRRGEFRRGEQSTRKIPGPPLTLTKMCRCYCDSLDCKFAVRGLYIGRERHRKKWILP